MVPWTRCPSAGRFNSQLSIFRGTQSLIEVFDGFCHQYKALFYVIWVEVVFTAH